MSAEWGEAKMELKLVVLAGARQGTEIPLKKDKFVIGRAKECALRAGSEAISRQHCIIRRRERGWTVRDLGSRNGTYVNDTRIEAETPLEAGSELRVGPLRFRVAPVVTPVAAENGQSSETKPRKAPPVKNMTDVAQRTASNSAGDATEEDISNWLLGTPDPNAMMKETRTIRMEETRALSRPHAAPPTAPPAEQPAAEEGADEAESALEAEPNETPEAEKSGWGLFKMGKGAAKRKPGKLPPRAAEPSKDSREAAADILREMTRRR
jgi:pSer/pThr/pTyr-binding forkhead associated (FHA) protein